jgi:signal transduction histidine kinase
MPRLGTRLAVFNLLSKLVFTIVFIIFLPYLVERINLIQTDDELIEKREQVIKLISQVGIEPFINSDSPSEFGSFNILKEEFISLEKTKLEEDWNFIEISERLIDNETIEYRVLNYSFQINGETYLLEIGKSLKSIDYAKRNIKRIILLFLTSIILITLAADLIYTKRILKPLKIITGKLKKTSDPAAFDKSPVTTSTTDFNQLDQTITELMNRIDDLFMKEKEITANISHELLTPVSVLRSKLENMLLKPDLDHDTESKIEESLRTLHRLKALINSLLLVARIESKQFIKEDNVNMREVLNEILTELKPISDDKGTILRAEYETEFVFGKANRSLIFSMIYNVVNNAIKNTGPEGCICIKSQADQEKYLLEISDTGSGMDEAQLKSLFSRFRNKPDSQKESTGLGLAITKSIADFHNIKISIVSVPSKGTKFFFTFPQNS